MLIVVLFKPIIIANLFGDIYSIDFLPLILYSLTIMCLNTLILNICLGFSNIKGYSWIHISWSIQNVLLNAYLIYQYQLKGAVYGFILNQSVVLFITLFFIRKYKWTKYLFTLPKYHKEWITPFFKYSLVYTMSFILVPFVYIFIRTQISNSLGWDEVGYWESINKLSFLYMYFISNIINVYFIPTYSKESLGTIKNNFYLHLVYCIGIFLCGAFLLYLLKKYIIVLIFSEEFLVIQDYIIYQLIGDFFRIISLFLSSIFIARARLKNQLMIEFFTILTFPVLVYFTLEDYKLYGVLGAYIFWYFIYDVLLFLYVRKIFKE
jgi:PST family polysaccharide transporter